jgi:hypothetical protein
MGTTNADPAGAWLGVQPSEAPPGQGLPGEQHPDAVEPPVKVGQAGPEIRPKPGHRRQAPQGGADDLVSGVSGACSS